MLRSGKTGSWLRAHAFPAWTYRTAEWKCKQVPGYPAGRKYPMFQLANAFVPG
jgi:hypothetical protein